MDPSQSGNLKSVHESIVKTSDGPRKRWRRNQVACDSCHSRRVRCDRAFPCSRCLRSDIRCEFTRERRKRGRISRKRPAQDGAGDGNSNNGTVGHNINRDTAAPVVTEQTAASPSLQQAFPKSSIQRPSRNTTASSSSSSCSASCNLNDYVPVVPTPTIANGQHFVGEDGGPIQGKTTIDGTVTDGWSSATHVSPDSHPGWSDGPLPRPFEIWTEADLAGNPVPPSENLRRGMGHASRTITTPSPLKYPVLQPLMPFLEGYLPRRLAFDLLRLYFTSAYSNHVHPICHHIHCYVLRKSSFLSQDAPRSSSPALLASMLWVAALDHRAFGLSISPHQRKKVCRFLCALTVRLLRPLTHAPSNNLDLFTDDYGSSTTANYGSSAAAMNPLEAAGDDRGLVGPAGSLDDVITYIHVASIISASEQKAASMRWWHAAFTLARELRLNQEIEGTPTVDTQTDGSCSPYDFSPLDWSTQNHFHLDYSAQERPVLNCVCDQSRSLPNSITEEHREERRRAWWLLYIMDRHLALCYNRPLALLDAESEDLLLPLDEGSWQAGNIHSNSPKPGGPQCPVSGQMNKRRLYPNFICHDHSIFGFFLPLMTITGELIDLNQARNHPLLGSRLQANEALGVHLNEVMRQLEIYKSSLVAFATMKQPSETETTPFPSQQPPPEADHQRKSAPPASVASIGPSIDTTHPSSPASYWHTQTVIAYASYLVHVLHILLVGKWDPVTLIEDKDFWTSSPAFASTISHSLKAADSAEQILRLDPDVSFMPYFFGIQLLQGSFLLLLIVERLQQEAGEGILNACEVMIRATESCVVTLNTEYQRNFRQVMWSAVAQARGRPVNQSEIRHRRKAVLALYRWTRNGTGLAL